jgi:hypothetical protein
MPDEISSPPPLPQPDDRPWQFSLLHLFGLTTVVAVGAGAFYWSPMIGTGVSFSLFLTISTFYRSRAVVRTAAPSLRNRSLPALLGFAIVTSFVACFAALVAFCVTCTAGGMVILWAGPKDPVPFIVMASLLGVIPMLVVLYRSWPRRPLPK